MSFWDTVIQDTPAMLLPPPENTPYDNVLGTATGLNSSINDAGAEAVHPSLSPDPNSPNRLTATAGEPAGFGLDPTVLTPNVFASWHTAFQEEYVNRHKDGNGFVTISGGGDPIHVTLSAAQDKVFILESLQKADFSSMTKADQTRIATVPDPALLAAVKAVLTRLGMINAAGEIATSADVVGPDSLFQQTRDAMALIVLPIMSDAETLVFKDELTNIETEISRMGVYSPTDINAAVQAIKARFERVLAFAKTLRDPNLAERPAPFGDPNQTENVVSLDRNEGIARGFQAFMNSERQILAADNASLQISNTGKLEGLTKHLDAPNLVAAFQLAANLKDQAINAGDTEEINQINDLLKTYNTIQELINQTIATFDATKNDQTRGLMGYHHNNGEDGSENVPNDSERKVNTVDGNNNPIKIHNTTDELHDGHGEPPLTDAQMKAISMFEDTLNGSPPTPSPIEALLHIQRPTDFNFYDNKGMTLNYFQKPTWDTWSGTLGNTVQQISQQNQLKFNDINSLEKERTSHFQSATNALTKALDITSSIGRNIA